MTSNNPFEGTDVPDDGIDHLRGLLDWIETHTEDRQALNGLKTAWEKLTDTQATPAVQGATWAEAGEIPPRRWIIDNWLPAGRLSLMWGVGGGGKSRLALQLAAGVASGGGQHREWLESPNGDLSLGKDIPNDGCAVMYCSWEEEEMEFWRRLSEIAGVTRGADLPPAPWVTPERTENLQVFDLAERGAVWSPQHGRHTSTMAEITPTGKALRKTAEGMKAKLLIMDPTAAAYVANENDRGLVRSFCADWDGWARRNDCAVLLLAHPNKEGSQSGSTDWRGACRAVWELSQQKSGTRPRSGQTDDRPIEWVLDCVKSNYGPLPKPLLMEMEIKDGLRWKVRTLWDQKDFSDPAQTTEQVTRCDNEDREGRFGGV